MELRELRTFCTAAKLRSISKAAEELGIGQPTATTHVKKLEEELDTLESQLDEIIEGTVQRAAETRAYWFGAIAFAYASYADLLGIDTIVLQIATADTIAESGWSTVIYGVDAPVVVEASPGTLGRLLDAIDLRDASTFSSAFPVIFDLFEEVALPTGDPVDLYATADGKEDTLLVLQ
ncbi:MAG: LysR family transcriptional regulator, partial [Proteobacteria bacterium]|nr:LysR family transcriptional regulator [Pseudomonadota bacterium]